MKTRKLLLGILFLGISLDLSAQLKIQNPQKLTPAPKNSVFDLVKMDFSRFAFARLNSKSKLNNYPVIFEKEKLALTPVNETEFEAAESVITITVEDGKLVSHLHPECSETHDVQPNDYFFLKAEGADIEFTKDEAGSINLVIKHKAIMPIKK